MARGSYVAYANYGAESGESSGDERYRRKGKADRSGPTMADSSPDMDRKSRTSQTSPKIGLRGKARTKENGCNQNMEISVMAQGIFHGLKRKIFTPRVNISIALSLRHTHLLNAMAGRCRYLRRFRYLC